MHPGDHFDRYRIERVLGEGGMATVYLGRHETLQSAHALKVLRVDVPEIKRRLMAEGKVQSAIRHPNVVSVTDILDTSQGVALVMEYVDGPALDEYQDGRALPIDEVLHLFRGIVLGVGAAHRMGVVHRDLKSANILLHTTSNAGVIPKVTDFGLVKVFEGTGTRSGVTMGTPEYMSPEQIRDSARVDPRSDLWSLGVVLYEMLTGDVPFDGTDLLFIYNAIARGAYTPVIEVRSDVPAWLSKIVDGLLVVDPDARFASADVLIEQLDAAGAAPRPSAERPSIDGAEPKRWGRLVVGGGVLAGVGLLGLLCAGGGMLGWSRYERSTAPVLVDTPVPKLEVVASAPVVVAPEPKPEVVAPAPVVVAPEPKPEVVAPAPVVVAPTPQSPGRPVSTASFQRFVARHPEWERASAIASGRVDAGYLRDWTDGPPSGSVTRVSWGAAKAYCAGRGGLLALDAPPSTWSASSQTKQEWRDSDGHPAWRRHDGATSTKATTDRAFPFTGFRCRR